jgi:hypothetical protein
LLRNGWRSETPGRFSSSARVAGPAVRGVIASWLAPRGRPINFKSSESEMLSIVMSGPKAAELQARVALAEADYNVTDLTNHGLAEEPGHAFIICDGAARPRWIQKSSPSIRQC